MDLNGFIYWVSNKKHEKVYPLKIAANYFLLYPMRSREIITIGLAPSATSQGPQIKTTEPMVLIKVKNCSIESDLMLKNFCRPFNRLKRN